MSYGLDFRPCVVSDELTYVIINNLPLSEQQTDGFWHCLTIVWGEIIQKGKERKGKKDLYRKNCWDIINV